MTDTTNAQTPDTATAPQASAEADGFAVIEKLNAGERVIDELARRSQDWKRVDARHYRARKREASPNPGSCASGS